VDYGLTENVQEPDNASTGRVAIPASHRVFRNPEPLILKMNPIVIVRTHFVFDGISVCFIAAFAAGIRPNAIKPGFELWTDRRSPLTVVLGVYRQRTKPRRQRHERCFHDFPTVLAGRIGTVAFFWNLKIPDAHEPILKRLKVPDYLRW
jgi:hypothetical protein